MTDPASHPEDALPEPLCNLPGHCRLAIVAHTNAAVQRALAAQQPLIDAARSVCAAMLDNGELPAPQQAAPAGQAAAPEFDHDIGAERFKVVKGSYWWHVRIGDGTANVGKFHSESAAQDMALKLLTAFRDGAYMQFRSSEQAPAAEAVQPPAPGDVLADLEAAAARKWQGNPIAQQAGLFAQAAAEIRRLRAQPPAQAVRLTDEQLDRLTWGFFAKPQPTTANLARAVERAVWAANGLRGE